MPPRTGKYQLAVVPLAVMLTALTAACDRSATDGADASSPLIEEARRFRGLVDAGDYADAEALMVEDPRRWFEERSGSGTPWRIGPGARGPWADWDAHFASEKEEVGWRSGDRAAVLTIRETNDYFRLLERGWTTTEIVYLFDAAGRIEGLLIRAVGDRPPGRTEEFLRWAREHEPAELDYLMPGGEIDPGGDRPPRFRALLERWRDAQGLPALR